MDGGLKEIIFATTAPDDRAATDAAYSVEQELRKEGHDLTVALFGWESLCLRIAEHEAAYNLFVPWAGVSQARLEADSPGGAISDLAAKIDNLSTLMKAGSAPILPVDEPMAAPIDASEDAALHARIDTFRDLIRNDYQLKIAQKGLLALLETTDVTAQPRAIFRIKTNLATIAHELGNQKEAETLYEEAYAARPTDPAATANMSLVRLLQSRFDDSMSLARAALGAKPPAKQAIAYLMQAAARSDWKGEPDSLIPADLAGTIDADLGLAEFLRLRSVLGWEARVIELAKKHPDSDVFKRLKAHAVLAMATQTNAYLPGGLTAVSADELDAAATELKKSVSRQLDFVEGDFPELAAIANNAAICLRLAGRLPEAEEILARARALYPADRHLTRMLGLVQAVQGKSAEAAATLKSLTGDGEAALIYAELLANSDPPGALDLLKHAPDDTFPDHLRATRWQLMAEIALRIDNRAVFDEALAALGNDERNAPFVELLKVEDEIKKGKPAETFVEALQRIAAGLPEHADIPTRYMIARDLRRYERPLEASRLLEGRVDLRRASPATLLYLQALGAARRDDALRKALEAASDLVRDHPDVLWLTSAHAWNVGDLPGALVAIDRLLSIRPRHFQATLLKIEILMRQNKSTELLALLSDRVQDFAEPTLEGHFRLAAILGHFGFLDRAAVLAYRLFLAHRDEARAWKALSSLVLQEGMPGGKRAWEMPTAAPDAAVDVEFSDGEKVFFVIEPDVALRRLDVESWEPDHPLALAVVGQAPGAEFVMPDGREGKITQIRHKYVARLHYVLANYEQRFPTIFLFRSISVDPASLTGLEEIREELRERHDWVDAETRQYATNNWPLAVLAARIGGDTIDAAGAVTAPGLKVKVAQGNEPERQAAIQTIIAHDKKGCVVDLWTFWNIWHLGAMQVVQDVCGPIVISQAMLDGLYARRAKIAQSEVDGLRSMRWSGEGIALVEASVEEVKKWGDELDQVIAWVKANAEVRPVRATDELPDALREHLSDNRSNIFNEAVLALQGDLIFLSDDLPLRQMAQGIGAQKAVWLQAVVMTALDRRAIDLQTYCKWTALLVDAGQSYIGISGGALIAALAMDVMAGHDVPSQPFTSLIKVIGGKLADPHSHLVATLELLQVIWQDDRYEPLRQRATGQIVTMLLRERTADYQQIFNILRSASMRIPRLHQYLIGWARGHFLVETVPNSMSPVDSKARRKNRRGHRS